MLCLQNVTKFAWKESRWGRISTCLEPSGGNAGFEPLFNKNPTTTWMESCQVKIDLNGAVTGIMATASAGQGHESLVATITGRCCGEILRQ